LKVKKVKQEIGPSGKIKFNPEAVNDDSVVKVILRMIHGEYHKPDAIEKIAQMFEFILLVYFLGFRSALRIVSREKFRRLPKRINCLEKANPAI
jgi:hypothetical protein